MLSNEIPLILSFLKEGSSTNLTLYRSREEEDFKERSTQIELAFVKQRALEEEEVLQKKRKEVDEL